jgi:hypothetical protein
MDMENLSPGPKCPACFQKGIAHDDTGQMILPPGKHAKAMYQANASIKLKRAKLIQDKELTGYRPRQNGVSPIQALFIKLPTIRILTPISFPPADSQRPSRARLQIEQVNTNLNPPFKNCRRNQSTHMHALTVGLFSQRLAPACLT